MIDVVTDVRCKACDKSIVRVPGRRPREYCNDACRQKHYRQHHQVEKGQSTLEQQNIAALKEKLTATAGRISKLERQVQVQRSRVGELTEENRTLRTFIDQMRDIEEAFSTDTSVHSFRRFLDSHPNHAVRPGCAKILDRGMRIIPSGSRGQYIKAMRKAGFSHDEQADVWDAWRDMLKEELFQSYYANRDKA
jgi:hypothetical protein